MNCCCQSDSRGHEIRASRSLNHNSAVSNPRPKLQTGLIWPVTSFALALSSMILVKGTIGFAQADESLPNSRQAVVLLVNLFCLYGQLTDISLCSQNLAICFRYCDP